MSENNNLKEDYVGGTSYLYSEKNKDLYLETFQNRSCPQTKNVFLLLDNNDAQSKLQNLSNHLNSCSICKKEFHRLRGQSYKVDALIPDPKVPRDLQNQFESQLHNIMTELKVTAKPLAAERITLVNKIKRIFIR